MAILLVDKKFTNCKSPLLRQHTVNQSLFFVCSSLALSFNRTFRVTYLILANDQLDAQFFFLYVYYNSLHVSSNLVLIIRRINCINTTSGICHSL
jgi:hypothetical protein